MPIEILFDETDIQRIINLNAAPPTGIRNAALIIGASYWGLTTSELTLLPLDAVMAESGEFYRVWTLPASVSYTGQERELHTENHVVPILEAYMCWYINSQVTRSNLNWYRNSDPKGKFFLNDRLERFEMTLRKKGGSDYQPKLMNEKLKSFIKKAGYEGATPRTFRDSWIKMMYDNGCHYNELMEVSGIKSKETLDKKIKPKKETMDSVFQSIFNRVKLPK
ncbi:MAG: site-specific integrase [Colwellia sp.]|jgi:Phage integrase family.